jgi:hypothetical protein
MPKSRGRKGKQRRERQSRPQISDADWEMLCVMQGVNDAEARGDACGALSIIDAHPVGPDGRLFWRSERVVRLHQLELLEWYLPRWATSRWILAQALQMMDPAHHSSFHRALSIAIEIRGGAANLVGTDEVDAEVKVSEHDWVFRQLMLWEYGGLATFLRTVATPDLVAGADRIRDWVDAPMRVLRFLGRSARTLHFADVASGESVDVLDLGSAAMLLPQECLLGRIVPTQEGAIFEGVPLRIPDDIALDAAADPSYWVDALRRGARTERPEEDRVAPAIVGRSDLLTDVPAIVWQVAVLQHAGHLGERGLGSRDLVAAAIGVVRAVIADELEVSDDLVDPWSCIGAALVHPTVVVGLDGAFAPEDAPGLLALAERLVGPAAEICRDLADAVPGAA